MEEYVEGQPLDRELAAGEPLNEAAAIAFLADILPVLVFVHSQNAIHRDIKPANLIRRTGDGKIFLIDFGAVKEVQKLAAGGTGQSPKSISIGSPGYAPLEQQMGNPQYSSDLYAVGLVCLQALTGLTPPELPKDSQTKEYRWEMSLVH